MIQKIALAEEILRTINGGDVTNNVGLQLEDIVMHVNMAHAAMLKQDIYERRQLEGEWSIDPQILSEYQGIPVVYPEPNLAIGACQPTIVLPSQVVDLPDDMGVYRVWSCCDPFLSFKRIPTAGASMYGPYVIGKIGPAWWIQDGKLHFMNLDKRVHTAVNLLLVDAGDNEEAYISPSVADRVKDKVLQLLANLNRIPEDKVSDSNKTTG